VDDTHQYKFEYFDMPGKERHHKYIHKYVNGATAIVYMFDCTLQFTKIDVNRSSFEKVEQWVSETDKCYIPIKVLVGNKLDLAQTKKNLINPVTKDEARKLARDFGMEFFETCSVGAQATVMNVFEYLLLQLLSLIPNPPDPERLMGKNVVLGKRLLGDVKFKMALAEMLPNYD